MIHMKLRFFPVMKLRSNLIRSEIILLHATPHVSQRDVWQLESPQQHTLNSQPHHIESSEQRSNMSAVAASTTPTACPLSSDSTASSFAVCQKIRGLTYDDILYRLGWHRVEPVHIYPKDRNACHKQLNGLHPV